MNKRQKKKALKKRLMVMSVNMPPLTRHSIHDMDQMITAFESMLGRGREHKVSLKESFMKMDEADKIISISNLPKLTVPGRLLPYYQHISNKSNKEEYIDKQE